MKETLTLQGGDGRQKPPNRVLFLMTGRFGLPRFVTQDSFARKLDLVAFFADALDHDLLAFAQLVTNIANPTIRDFRDMQQAVSAGKDFDERAKINDPADRANVSCSNFGFGS